ncbi:MAG: hypothetical protein LBC55_01720 [Desulfovibrio sp.]|jgi:hypothetical protein|nr:hypothetical protein [Desulfovibrio sp.]
MPYEKKTLFVIDPGFCDVAGHHLATNAMLYAVCGENAVRCTILASRDLARFVNSSPKDIVLLGKNCGLQNILCCFSEIVYKPQRIGGAGTVRSVKKTGLIFAEELRRVVEPHVTTDMVLFSHTANASIAYGYSLWLRQLRKAPPRVVVHYIALADDEAGMEADRFALGELREHASVTILGGSAPLCRRLEQYTGKATARLPTPLRVSQTRECPPPQDAFPVFGVVGEARTGKNFEIFPASIGRYLVAGGTGKFLIQMHRRDTSLDVVIRTLLTMREKLPSRIDLRLQPLYGEEYYNHLGRCDVVLLPYPVQTYRTKPTFIIFEAAALGVSAIVRRGTCMEDELRLLNNGSVFMDGGDPGDLTGALHAFAHDLAANRQAAFDAAPKCRAEHNRDKYFAILMGEA